MKKVFVVMLAFWGVTAFVQAQEISGEKVFMDVCAACHGMKGERSPPSPEPINTMEQDRIEGRLARARGNGPKGRMDRAVQSVTETQAKAVAEYIVTTLKPAP